MAAGPVGAVGVPGAVSSFPTGRLDGGQRDGQRRPVGDPPEPRPGRHRRAGHPADGRLRHSGGPPRSAPTSRRCDATSGSTARRRVSRPPASTCSRAAASPPRRPCRRPTGPRSPASWPRSFTTPPGRRSSRRWTSARMGDCGSTHRLPDQVDNPHITEAIKWSDAISHFADQTPERPTSWPSPVVAPFRPSSTRSRRPGWLRGHHRPDPPATGHPVADQPLRPPATRRSNNHSHPTAPDSRIGARSQGGLLALPEVLAERMIRAWQGPRTRWRSSILSAGPRSARSTVQFGSVAACGWDPGTVSSSSEKPGKPSAGSEVRNQNGWPGP